MGIKHDFESPKQNAAMNLRAPENTSTIEDLTWRDKLEEKDPELSKALEDKDKELAIRIIKLDEQTENITKILDVAEENKDKSTAREIFDNIINLITDINSIDLIAQELEPESSSGAFGPLRRQIEKRAQKMKILSNKAQMILIGDDIRKEQGSTDKKAA